MRWYARVAALGFLGLLVMAYGLILMVPDTRAVVYSGAGLLGLSIALVVLRVAARLRDGVRR